MISLLLVLFFVLAFSAVRGMAFPFLISATYTAFFLFFMFLFEYYESIHLIQIDYTHILLLQIAASLFLVYVVRVYDKIGYAFVFASLQCLSICVNILMMLCYIYTTSSLYDAARDNYLIVNNSLLCADIVALIGCAYGESKRINYIRS